MRFVIAVFCIQLCISVVVKNFQTLKMENRTLRFKKLTQDV